jgi:leader peptidase (prepilin peptidase)/N-methyltransferase
LIDLHGTAGGLLYAVLGLVAGSFATAASHRLPRDLPLAVDRSRCPSCDHVLGAGDLVPVLSWLAARGRCRYCGAPVSVRYPATELLMALLFVGAWRLAGDDDLAAAMLALTALGLVVIAIADLEARIIPDPVLLGLLPVAVAWRWHNGGDWVDGIGGAALGSALLFGLRAGFKALRGLDALGLGDVKFMALAGLYVGVTGLAPFLLVSGLAGIGFGLVWRLAKREAAFPFGPALCIALAVMLVAPDWFDNFLLFTP